MRSETKIGVGVGALLLVIIVGYLAVHTSEKKGDAIDTTATTGSNSSDHNTSATATPVTPAPVMPDKTTIAQSNSAAESKPVDTTPAATTTPPTVGTSAVSVSGPASPTTAPSVAIGGPSASPTAGQTSGASTATPDSTASARPGNADWNKLLNDGPTAGDNTSGSATIGTGQGGTSTSSLYASGASTSVDTGLHTSGTSTAHPSRLGGPTTAPSGAAATGKHVIKVGETLSSIAAATYGSPHYWPAIARANPGLNPNTMHAGQSINLPEVSAVKVAPSAPDRTPPPSGSTLVVDPTKEYSVQSGDSLYAISMRLYGTPSRAEQIYELNKATIGPSMSRLKIHQVLKLPAPPATKPA